MDNETSPDEMESPTREEVETTTDEEAPEKLRSKGISSKQIRIGVVVAVVAVLVVVLLWGMVPDKIYEVHQAVDDIDSLDGEYVSVKGLIVSWEVGTSDFIIADTNDENITIMVQHTGPIPEGFGINATAVVKGTIHKAEPADRMKTDEIQIGCPSKY
ncbi:MAG: cytochrome c maturation protein CcmE [Thermoplasmata archaeon]|nr:cytochrome c maturation protein CcmE [Thermoplasmata archaeon]